MSGWAWLLVALPAAMAALYGLHRLCLRLEEQGLLYYWHKRSESSAAGAFVALQQAIEPASQHVFHIEDERRSHSDEEAPGGPADDDPRQDTLGDSGELATH